MSLRDVVEQAIGTVSPDPEAERAAMIDKIRRAREDFRRDPDQAGGWITKAEAGRVAFAPTRPDGQQLVIGGQSVNFFQLDEIGGVLDAFEAAVAAGELDPQLTGETPAGHSLPLEWLSPGHSG